ncbi:MAG: polysaccharide biosynthesis C-terminal domain-containing protein [Candidatus Latescibacterota bacterium]|nr:polysaccharide biosynthesis C-terminal domain-containing protein [Candidatus Latescibacterota bacterium]
MSFFRGFSTNVACTGLAFAIGLANQSLLAHGLGPEGRGVYGIVATTVMLGGLLFGEWLSRGNAYIAGKEPQATGSVMSNGLLFTVALLTVMLLGSRLLVCLNLHPPGLQTTALSVMSLIIVMTVLQRAAQGVLLGRDRIGAYAIVPVLFISVYLGGNVWVLQHTAYGIDGVLIAWTGASVVAAVVAAVAVGQFGSPSLSQLRCTAAVGGRGAVSTTLIFLLFRSDVYLVGLFLGAAPLGIYSVALVVAEMVQRLPNVAGATLLPKVIGGSDDDHLLSLRVTRLVLLFSLATGVGILLVGEPLLTWVFSEAFSGSIVPLRWMLPGLIASGYSSVLNTKLAGHGYPKITIMAPAVALAANVTLNLVLIPALELRGAALATSISYALWAFIITAAYQRRTGVRWRDFLPL